MAKAVRVELRADMPFAEAAGLTVRIRTGELFAQADGVLDTGDIERVHDMRVASRRLRAALEIFAPCFRRKQLKPVLRDVKRLADALGARRDPDVQIEEMGAVAAELGVAKADGVAALLAGLRAEQAAGNAVLAAGLQEAQRSGLAERLLALAERAR